MEQKIDFLFYLMVSGIPGRPYFAPPAGPEAVPVDIAVIVDEGGEIVGLTLSRAVLVGSLNLGL